ncbi:MAG: T9SS type A sorting domain-containing protein, partial [Acholeplasmataceae bacterium]|nr:T9SS type A sorting domain-containing protein [Acholeplasmataceae bacterium]
GELSDPKVVQIISTIGISEQNTIDLHIYPNPAHGQITIKSSRSVNTSLMIRLTDVLGKVMRSKQIESAADGFTHQLDITDIPNGIYFLRVEGDGVRSSLKLVIQ